MKIKVAVADDNPGIIRLVQEQLHTSARLECVCTAGNGAGLLEHIAEIAPDVALIDLQMPVMDGITCIGRLRILCPQARIIVLSVFDDEEKIFQAIQAGANGYLLKEDLTDKLITGIMEIMEGGAPMSPSIANKALKLLRGVHIDRPKSSEEVPLTARETEVLEGLSQGWYLKEIAGNLNISTGTVRKHIENIYTKLQVHNKVEAVQKANRLRLL